MYVNTTEITKTITAYLSHKLQGYLKEGDNVNVMKGT